MSKRQATDTQALENGMEIDLPINGGERITGNIEKGERRKKKATGNDVGLGGDDEMGEFEDMFEDEMESEDEVVESEGSAESDLEELEDGRYIQKNMLSRIKEEQDREKEEEQEEMGERESKVYLPGDKLEKDEELVVDNTAYQMLHFLNVSWPCLSFDVVRDGLGENRTRFPQTMTIFTGTQADEAHKNEVMLMKMTKLHRTINDGKEQDENDDDEMDEDLDEDPVVQVRTMKHRGGVNRVRVKQSYDSPLGATWSDEGKVYIWDLKEQLNSLETSTYNLQAKAREPVYTVSTHDVEGFALDWHSDGRLLTGDCDKFIYLTQQRTDNGLFVTDKSAFRGHKQSVEDLQWSPSEQNVFASCSADQTIRIWDTRANNRKTSRLCVSQAHNSDVNVISWNKVSQYLMASGADDGKFSIWDLRTWGGGASGQKRILPVATMDWHKAPVTSIEWHPTDDSVIAVSGADDQLTIWDLSVELDPEEEQNGAGSRAVNEFVGADGSRRTVPPQLLFVHQGQRDIKELHWHPQIPGAIVSTAYSGFGVFKTISV
ncbi:Ribosome assembly protein rrb1 [Zancudomyces culisetae]|uniref:Glutamate-rich WD repeat-containing protein 1 n=1 Tax=Zancudomyces culisetae TaxID=1213189 RepID=A0A1R1PC87_ZANCU|nr:Ribosome assembly protein rrb1 [Zancudomyces culisetae]OMH84992.1 Ribosome assembly protein rrb1 [Zancudomyces culisetae]|eukprot:OMH78574.1 Ribosome assembly protein rrb1 [Zancudomyces culisetae]